MSFIRRKEDFVCSYCNKTNKGNGYTNHCTSCLYSKHVDVSPGDREGLCCGLMRPIFVSYTHKESYIIHKCEVCSFERKNKIQLDDSLDAMSKIQSKQ